MPDGQAVPVPLIIGIKQMAATGLQFAWRGGRPPSLPAARRSSGGTNSEFRWNPDWLDLLHAHITQIWHIDEKRFICAFPAGGTMRWGLAHPNRFATLTPMAFTLGPR